ncbi:MAG: hypothetical protein OEQ74_12045 [Gammaproteobacteria bacterium]|nr:hypothetical protein [Gammaproteobacteria bacterium]
MIKRAILSKRAVSAPRRALLLTFIAWMNIAMAPCAMAFGDTSGCLHGAAEVDAATMSHDGTHGAHGAHEGHGTQHGGTAGPDCGMTGNDCCATQNDGATDTRGQKSVDIESTDEIVPFETHSVSTHAADIAMCRAVDRPPGRFVTSPPIHVLNCVYRD